MKAARILAAAACAALAQGAVANDGYWFDRDGYTIASGGGGCWKTQRWTPGHALAACGDKPVDAGVVLLIREERSVSRPVPTRSHVPQEVRVKSSGTVFFATNSKAVDKGAFSEAASEMARMDARDVSLVAEGSADRRGSKSANARLSKERARAAAETARGDFSGQSDRVAGTGAVGLGAVSEKGFCRGALDQEVCLAPDRKAVLEASGFGYPRQR